MESSKRKLSTDSTVGEEDDDQVVKRVHRRNGEDPPNSCCCKLVVQQQQEIERLKLLLQAQEDSPVVASTTTSTTALEEKVNRLTALIEKQHEAKPAATANYSLDSLHNKVDKLIRLMSTTFETQAKMSKSLETFLKSSKVKPPPTSMGATLKHLQNLEEKEKKKEEKADEEPPVEDLKDLLERQKSDDGLDELKWGQNLMLLGDNLWRTFNSVDDVNVMVKKMEKDLYFRISCRPNEVLSRLYDEKRDKLLFALPPRTYRIAVSVGSHELMTDDSLLTLRQASLEEVKQKNRGPLQEKARQLKCMVQKLLSLQKTVIIVIPPAGTQRVEIFRHWEEIVLDVMQDLPSPALRILNLPDLIRSTLPDFKSPEDHLTTWFSDLFHATLSPYGTRRLFDALKRSVWARSKKVLESRTFLNNSSGFTESSVCPRCTRNHPGGPSTCKSIDKMCRLCGLVGHFSEVHQVTDYKLRQEIVATLGFDLYAPVPVPVMGCEPESSISQPTTMSFVNPLLPQPGIDWPAGGTVGDWHLHS